MKTHTPIVMKTHSIIRRIIAALVLGAIFSAALPVIRAADAYPPARMPYQGFLVDGNGVPLANVRVQNFDIIFRIYDASQGGNILWAEQQTVTVDKGNFSILLGEGTAVGSEPRPSIDAVFGGVTASDRYIGLTVKRQGAADAEILPRLRLLPAPYAFLARNATSLIGPNGQPLISTATGTIQSAGGAPRGQGAVDLQNTRVDNGQVASGDYSVVGGGQNNRATKVNSVVSGGVGNSADGASSNVAGGIDNLANGVTATIGGGFQNVNSGQDSVIAGGHKNTNSAFAATIGGGQFNTASGNLSTVSGGFRNRATLANATVSGGAENVVRGITGTISGGFSNVVSALEATVGGGALNQATGDKSTVAGGVDNRAAGVQAAIGGGHLNKAGGINGAVGGGYNNSASGQESAIGGGNSNVASALRSTVAGGIDNQATRDHAAVGGGHLNRATGINSTVPGGYNNRAEGDQSFAAGRRAVAANHGSFVWADRIDADFRSTGENQFLIRANGGVGINTTSPTKAVVQIEGAKTVNVGAYGWLNRDAPTGKHPGGNMPYSLYASDRVGASEFNAFSDARTKNVIGRSNSDQDLNTLMKIEITDYTFRDTVTKGAGQHKKVIAQQVEGVFPQAVSTMTDVVPDIYQQAKTDGAWVHLATDLKAGEKVRLITSHSSEVFEVIEVTDSKFRVPNKLEGEVFVYGREVNDFQAVDYNAIAMLNVSATQKLFHLIQEQRELLDRHEAQIRELTASKDTQLSELREELESLKKLIGTVVHKYEVAAGN